MAIARRLPNPTHHGDDLRRRPGTHFHPPSPQPPTFIPLPPASFSGACHVRAVRLPYAPRPGQQELVDAIVQTHAGHGHLVAEAGTGTGKTIAALAGSLAQGPAGAMSEAPVLYATRTNSQQEQVLKEHRALRADGQETGWAIPFMGRRHYCPLLKDDERFQDGTPEELGRLCRDAKRKALRAHATGKEVPGACPYYARLLADGTGPVEALLESHEGDAAALGARIAAAGSCPYEALKLLIPQAALVVVPSIFVIDDRLRTTMLEWMGRTADEVRLVVDEAHHLPEAVRGHHSPRLGLGTIERALKEAEELKDPSLAGRFLMTGVLSGLHALIRDLADEYAQDAEDGWLPEDASREAMLVRFGAPGPVLERAAVELEDWGEVVREKRRQDGRLPRSYLGAVGSFLRFWLMLPDAPYVHLVVRDPRPSLEAYLLDPAPKCAFLRDFASTVHVSGTLAPLAGHARLLGLPSASQVHQPSPFDPERLRLYGMLGMRRDVQGTEPAEVVRQQEAARDLLARWSGRIGVFFPSHQMLNDYLEEGFLHGLQASVHAEVRGMSHAEIQALLERFRTDGGRHVLLLGVLGGRLTEGIDYPGDLMERMIVLGVPYPRPSARSRALIAYFDRLDGTGWRTAVHDPTGRTLRQAVGRLIRGPEDTGTVAVLDDRVVRFRDHLPRLRMVAGTELVTDDPAPLQEGFLPAAHL